LFPVLLLACSIPALSQGCEPSASTNAILEKLQVPDDVHLPAVRRRELRLRLLRTALSKASKDVFLNEAYQSERFLDGDRSGVIDEYESLLAENPQEPTLLYLAANAESGLKTNEAISKLTLALKLAPDFALPHLLLAQIFSSERYKNPAQVNLHLRRFSALCPGSVRTLSTLAWSKDVDLIKAEAVRLRTNIDARTDSTAVAAYPTLWMLEGAGVRSDQQSVNQARMLRDLDRLFTPQFARNSAWHSTLWQATGFEGTPSDIGYKGQEEIARLYPDSVEACKYEAHKVRAHLEYPVKGTQSQLTAYWSSTWRAVLPVTLRCPRVLEVAFTVADAAVRDRSASDSEVSTALEAYLKSVELDPAGYRLLPPGPISIAQLLVERGGPFERVPDLVSKGLLEVDRTAASDSSDLYDASRFTPSHVSASLYVMGYLPLAEAHIRLGNLSKANETILEIDSKLDQLRPVPEASSQEKTSFAELAAQYWFVRGLYAEADHRSIDALVDYWNSVQLFPVRTSALDRREEAMDSAKRIWKALGGSTQGWSDWAEANPLTAFFAGKDDTAAWLRLARIFPHLVFKDTLGNSWKPQELATKTTFVALWASWCGGCRAELPYLEKLYQRFRGREDVVILALDVDDDPREMTEVLNALKISTPSVVARDFAYSLVSETALPANWIITPKKSEMFQGNDRSHEAWLQEATEALEKATGR